MQPLILDAAQAQEGQDVAALQPPPQQQQQQQQQAAAACQNAHVEVLAAVAADSTAANNSASGSAAGDVLDGDCPTTDAIAAAHTQPAAQHQSLAEHGIPGGATPPSQPRLSYWQQRRAERRARDSSGSPAASTVASALWQYRNRQLDALAAAVAPSCRQLSQALAAPGTAAADAGSPPGSSRHEAAVPVMQQAAERRPQQQQEPCTARSAADSGVIGPQERQAVLQELLAERRSRRRLSQPADCLGAGPSALDGSVGGVPQRQSGHTARASPAAPVAAASSAGSDEDGAAQPASKAPRPAGSPAALTSMLSPLPTTDPIAAVDDAAAHAPAFSDSHGSAAPAAEQPLQEWSNLEARTPRSSTLQSDATGDQLLLWHLMCFACNIGKGGERGSRCRLVHLCIRHWNCTSCGGQRQILRFISFYSAVSSDWAADEARLAALALALGQRRPGDAPGAFEIDTRLLYR